MIEILLVEDNPGDVDLTREVLREIEVPHRLQVAPNGLVALQCLRDQGLWDAGKPDLVILDLNLPQKSGLEVLEEIKSDPDFRQIPVLMFSCSSAAADVLGSYERQANCYITKPADLDAFAEIFRSIEHFWFRTARLPREESALMDPMPA